MKKHLDLFRALVAFVLFGNAVSHSLQLPVQQQQEGLTGPGVGIGGTGGVNGGFEGPAGSITGRRPGNGLFGTGPDGVLGGMGPGAGGGIGRGQGSGGNRGLLGGLSAPAVPGRDLQGAFPELLGSGSQSGTPGAGVNSPGRASFDPGLFGSPSDTGRGGSVSGGPLSGTRGPQGLPGLQGSSGVPSFPGALGSLPGQLPGVRGGISTSGGNSRPFGPGEVGPGGLGITSGTGTLGPLPGGPGVGSGPFGGRQSSGAGLSPEGVPGIPSSFGSNGTPGPAAAPSGPGSFGGGAGGAGGEGAPLGGGSGISGSGQGDSLFPSVGGAEGAGAIATPTDGSNGSPSVAEGTGGSGEPGSSSLTGSGIQGAGTGQAGRPSSGRGVAAGRRRGRPRKPLSQTDKAAIGLGVASGLLAVTALGAAIAGAVHQHQHRQGRPGPALGGRRPGCMRPQCVNGCGRQRRSLPESKVPAEILNKIQKDLERLY